MHSIHFCVPQLFDAGSDPAEKTAVRAHLDRCLSRLRTTEPTTRLIDAGKSTIAFLLPRAFHTNSDLVANAEALRPLLDCLCDIDFEYLRYRKPLVGTPQLPYLYDHPLRYGRTVIWDSTPALYLRGKGDCKSLVGARVAELRFAGIEANPQFRFLPPKMTDNGQFQYHILDQTPIAPVETNWVEDPSKVKGMGKDEWAYFQQTPATHGDAASSYGRPSHKKLFSFLGRLVA